MHLGMSPTDPAGTREAALADGYLPYGAFSRAWERAVFLGIGLVMPFVWPSAIHLVSCGSPPHSRAAVAAWLAYVAVQVANKMPVSFTYTARGWHAALDIGGYALMLLCTVLFVLGLQNLLPVLVWQAAALLALASLGAYLVTRMEIAGEAIPIRRELLCKGLTVLLNTPMLLVLAVMVLGPLALP